MTELSSCDFFQRSPIGLWSINISYQQHIWWTQFQVTFLKVRFKYLTAKYWTYWAVFNIYFKPGSYLMNLISCDFIRTSALIISKQIIGHIKPCLINTSYQDHICWTRSLMSFFERPLNILKQNKVYNLWKLHKMDPFLN